MRIEALKFYNEDKSEITILVGAYDSYDNIIIRIEDIYIREYRKQKRISIRSKYSDDYKYRNLDSKGRDEYLKQKYLTYVSEEQLKQAVLNAWEMIKPATDNLDNIIVF